jgi:signal transduction histidine kinase
VHRDANGSRFGSGGSRFFAAAGLSIAPWTVVYTAPTRFLFASRGTDWRLSVLLLAGFLAAAAVCLALLVGLLRGSDKLAHANAALEVGNDQLRSATEAKSRFVASMAHELRTPLSAVLGFSELMQVGRAGPMNETQAEYLGIVRSSADHLLLLINDALDLATVEAGQLTLRPEAIDPARVARECADAVRGLADARDVRVALVAEGRGRVSLDPGSCRLRAAKSASGAAWEPAARSPRGCRGAALRSSGLLRPTATRRAPGAADRASPPASVPAEPP